MLHYGYSTVDQRYFSEVCSSIAPLGCFSVFGEVVRGAGVAAGVKQSICEKGSLLDTLQERGTTPPVQAKWGAINENNLDIEQQPTPQPHF